MIGLNIDLEDPEVIRQIIGSFVAGDPEHAPAELREFMCARVYQIKPDEYRRFMRGGMGLIPGGFKPSFPEDFATVAILDGEDVLHDPEGFLEEAYQLTNSTDCCWTEDDRDDRLIPVVDGCRSTSIGDVIELVARDGENVRANVAAGGFTPRAS